MASNSIVSIFGREPDASFSCEAIQFGDFEIWKNVEEGYTALINLKRPNGIFVQLDDYEPVGQQLARAAETYRDKNKRYICLHLKTTNSNPSQVSVGLHGFFAQMEDPSLLRDLKLRITLSMNLIHISTRGISCLVVDSELNLASGKNRVFDHLDKWDKERVCVENEDFFESISTTFGDSLSTILSKYNDKAWRLVGSAKFVFFRDLMRLNQLSICEKMKGQMRDITVVSSNGKEFPCHKHFLTGHSPVYAANFKHNDKMKRMEMPDLSEVNLKALVEFLYERNVEKPMESCWTAFELLQVGHRDNIDTLELEMKRILLAKPREWFESEMTLRLFMFAKNVEAFDDLKVKAVLVMKSKPEFGDMNYLRDLFKDDFAAGLELCQCLLKSK